MKITFAGTTSQEIPTLRGSTGEGQLQHVSGTSTIVVEGSMDGGVTYVGIGLRKSIDDTIVASSAVAGLYYFRVGYDKIRVRCSGFVDSTEIWAEVKPI